MSPHRHPSLARTATADREVAALADGEVSGRTKMSACKMTERFRRHKNFCKHRCWLLNCQPFGLPSPPGVGTSPVRLSSHFLPFQGRLFRCFEFCFYFLPCCYFKICHHNFQCRHIGTQASPEQPQLTEKWQLWLTERFRAGRQIKIVFWDLVHKFLFNFAIKIDKKKTML